MDGLKLRDVSMGRQEKPLGLAPPVPDSVEETGLDSQFLLRFVLKSAYMDNLETAGELAEHIALPTAVVSDVLEGAREDRLVEVLGLGGERGSVYRYALTEAGRERAQEAIQQSMYTGPAPVSFDAYRRQVAKQSIAHDKITPDTLRQALSHLVFPEGTVERLGPAVNSAKAVLLYGTPGNGKTSIAEALGSAFAQQIYVPHCFEVGGQIIRVFDPNLHVLGDQEADDSAAVDARWVRCQRPVVITGGELTIEMLDLSFDPIAKYYEAPAHVKANNGVFIIDDFGRQRVRPMDLLNRWIMPLERRVDFIALHTGRKLEVPFDELVIFSTNAPPQDLMDGAGLRRIPYKFRVAAPTPGDYASILRRLCADAGLALEEGVLPYLLDAFYPQTGFPISAAHPKFIVQHVQERCRFQGIEARLCLDLVHDAVENLLVEGEPPPVRPHA